MRSPRALWAVLITLAVASCSAEPAAAPTPAAPRTYLIPAETARPDEAVIKAAPVVDGQMRFRVLGFSDGMPSMFGSHAEWNAKGYYARVRVQIESTDRTSQKFDAKQQLLVAADGRTFPIDTQGQAIKRQPDELPVGSFVKMQFDLWYDYPKDARITAIRFFGDPPLGAIGPSKGVEVRLR